MSKFKVGDRVHYSNEYNDLTGTLVRVDDSGDWVLRVDNKDYGGWYDDDTESSNCRWIFDGLDTDRLSHIVSFSPNDTVRLKSGEPFTTGSYTAEVDSVRGDIVLLKHGSWLAVDAVEKVEAWLPEGDGWTEYSGGGNPAPGAKVEWLLDWERRTRVYTHATYQSDLLSWNDAVVAYRVVEPATVTAAEPAAETDFDPVAQPTAVTLSIDGVSVEGSPQAIADLLRALAA